MPLKPFRPCCHPGCPRLTNERYCEQHKRPAWSKKKELRRFKGKSLQRQRDLLFDEYPLCVECLKVGRVTAATQRDHIGRSVKSVILQFKGN